MKKVRVELKWYMPESGQPIVSKTPYRPIIVFENQYLGDRKDQMLFSCQIFNEKIDKKSNESIATLELRVPGGPFEYLKRGVRFELFEANAKVADGIIIEEINNNN